MTRILAIAALVIIRELLGRALFNEFASPGVRLSLDFGFLLLVAHLAGQVFTRIGFPMITGYIVAGILFGPDGMSYISTEGVADLRFIDDLALAVIAMAAGAELRMEDLRKNRKAIAILVLSTSLGPFLAVLAASFLGGRWLPFLDGFPPKALLAAAILFGVLSMAKSPASTIAVISECKARGPFTKMVLSITVARDVVVILLFTAALSLSASLVDPGSPFDARLMGLVTVEVVLSIALGLFLAKLISLILRHLRADLGPAIIGCAFFVTKFSYFLGHFAETRMGMSFHLEPLLICMAAGFAIQNFTREGTRLVDTIDRITLPIYTVFFAISGAGLDLGVLGSCWPAALTLVLVRILGMFLGSILGCRIAGLPKMHGRLMGFGFITQAGVTLGLVRVVATRFPSFGEDLAVVVVAAVVLNQIVGPAALKIALDLVGEARTSRRPKLSPKR